MSKTDKLWQAIGDIDDSFVVEASAKRPKVLQGHWGLAASVACFCLVIASVVFMRGVGLLTPATQPTEPTTAPITSTQPPETTKETAPPIQTVPHNTLPTPELQMYNDLFSDPYGWYNAALRCEYATPEDISLLMLFYGGFEDESRDPTDEEWAQLKDIEGFNENYDLLRLPVRKMDTILTELFGISLADVKPEGFEGLTYLESTDCWYHMTTSIRYADFTARDVKPTLTGTKVYYDGGYKGNMVVTVTPNGSGGYRILSNLPMDAAEQERIDKITTLFGEEGSWYNLALTSQYGSAAELGLRYFFMNGFATESREATDQEWELLKNDTVVDLEETLIRLPVEKMDAILMQYFGITVDQMNKNSSAFAGMTYLEETKCWYLSTPATTSVRSFKVQSVTDFSDGTLQVNYIASSRPQVNVLEEVYILRLKSSGDGYQILCNMPADTTVPADPVSYFSDRKSWQNCMILSLFSRPEEASLSALFERPIDGESTEPTDLERQLLPELMERYDPLLLFRATKEQLDEVLRSVLNITTDQLPAGWEQEFTYLPETGCYYKLVSRNYGYNVSVSHVTENADGTVNVYYDLSYSLEGAPDQVVRLQPHENGYYMLSNEKYVDNTGKTEEQIAMETLFTPYNSWYGKALISYYETPEKMSLRNFFDNGFEGESQKPTDEEWEQLKDMQGFNENYDFFRLPVSKMNDVLMEYFGITLDQMDASAFEGLTYLESTDCWYYMATGSRYVSGFVAQAVEHLPDGTIQVQYTVNYPEGLAVVTIKPYGDGYRILSNLPADTTVPTTKPTMPETEVMQDIEKAWKKRTGEELEWYTDNLWVGMRYYGSYDGYEILFYPTESVTDMFAELTVGGCSFWHSDTFEIYAYRDGKFRTLLDAYDSGDISGDSVAAIYEIHKPFAKL